MGSLRARDRAVVVIGGEEESEGHRLFGAPRLDPFLQEALTFMVELPGMVIGLKEVVVRMSGDGVVRDVL